MCDIYLTGQVNENNKDGSQSKAVVILVALLECRRQRSEKYGDERTKKSVYIS